MSKVVTEPPVTSNTSTNLSPLKEILSPPSTINSGNPSPPAFTAGTIPPPAPTANLNPVSTVAGEPPAADCTSIKFFPSNFLTAPPSTTNSGAPPPPATNCCTPLPSRPSDAPPAADNKSPDLASAPLPFASTLHPISAAFHLPIPPPEASHPHVHPTTANLPNYPAPHAPPDPRPAGAPPP